MARLVVVTQRVDSGDPALGFFVSWLDRLAARFDRIDVIAIKEGTHGNSDSVKVHTLPENKLLRLFGFLYLSLKLLPGSAGMFAHMCPEYVVAGGWIARLMGKPVLLWYTHRSVTWRLRIAALFATGIFTASPEGCRLESGKVEAVGHGIDTLNFRPLDRERVVPGSILTAGRVTPIKRLELLVAAMPEVLKRVPEAKLVILGGAYLSEDRAYEATLADLARGLGVEGSVEWHGSEGHSAMPDAYREAALVVNLAPTGGLDKVVLEAMSCARPVAVANEGFWSMLTGDAERGRIRDLSPQALGERIASLLAGPYDAEPLRRAIIERHSLDKLADRIAGFFGVPPETL